MFMTRRKIAVIGAGFTGATTAFMLAERGLGDIVLVDIPQQESPTKGKALDMQEAMPVLGRDVTITGTSSYEDIQGADLVIITAGIARKPGMSRDDLVSTNAGIVRQVSEQIKVHAPQALVLVLSNPADVMTYVAYQTTGFPKERVFGQSGVLDTARFRTFVAEATGVSVRDVTGFVLGGHGDDMVPLIRYSYVGGIPLEQWLDAETIEKIVERTRKGGGEIVSLLGSGSAYYAPAASLTEMAEAVLLDQKRILPAIAYLEGQYGHHDLYVGVPVVLGASGVEKILSLELTESEQAAFDRSVQSVRKVMAAIGLS
ncbi:MAG: malate dehydrogenase [Candidatus Carbobacillus sp.]|nr:malate dehydrogenase [Candidatus Carbobacillus sp.]